MTDKKEIVQRFLDAEGPNQSALAELQKGMEPHGGGNLLLAVRQFGDDVLDNVRRLNRVHDFTIAVAGITQGPTPEKFGLDPNLVLQEHQEGPAVVDPRFMYPLRKATGKW